MEETQKTKAQIKKETLAKIKEVKAENPDMTRAQLVDALNAKQIMTPTGKPWQINNLYAFTHKQKRPAKAARAKKQTRIVHRKHSAPVVSSDAAARISGVRQALEIPFISDSVRVEVIKSALGL